MDKRFLFRPFRSSEKTHHLHHFLFSSLSSLDEDTTKVSSIFVVPDQASCRSSRMMEHIVTTPRPTILLRSTGASIRQPIQDFLRFALKVTCRMVIGVVVFFALYYAASSPPMHWFYEVSPPAGLNTVYIPGGGFSGFWFHLGYLQSLPNLQEYDYYCFSSGCLGILAALVNHTVDEVASVGFDAQAAWMEGNITRFELIDHFVDNLLAGEPDERLKEVLPNIKILVTTTKDGFEVKEAKNRAELKDHLAKTTWVPYLTGWGFLSDEEDFYLDGGFSRMIHPECEYNLQLPIVWETVVHTFSPGLSIDQVMDLWRAGTRYDFGLPGSGPKAHATDSPTASSSSFCEGRDAAHLSQCRI